jgi:hypothetical protein
MIALHHASPEVVIDSLYERAESITDPEERAKAINAVAAYQARVRFRPEVVPDEAPLPLSQCNLDDSEARSKAKALHALERRAREESRNRAKALSWIYDESEFRSILATGDLLIDEVELTSRFMDWINDASIVTLRDMTTGDRVRKLSPKRGNKAYAANYRKRLNDLEGAMAGLELSFPRAKGRDKYMMCRSFLITLTYDQKTVSKQNAWANISGDIAKFKILAKRCFGARSIASIAVKEGTQSGYPAPHLFFILNGPVTCVKRWSDAKQRYFYRIHSDLVYKGIHTGNPRTDRNGLVDCWKPGIGPDGEPSKSFIDVQGVVENRVQDGDRKVSVAHYLFKYLTKAIDIDSPGQAIRNLGVKTFAWQKLYRLRPVHLSKAFKVFVGARLDRLLSQSQQGNGSIWKFDSSQRCKLTDYIRVLTSALPPDPRPWPILGQSAPKSPENSSCCDSKTSMKHLVIA